MTEKGNIILPLIAASLIIALVAAGFLFWQKENLTEYLSALFNKPKISKVKISPADEPKTNDWKVYQNKEVGVSFKYPDNYSFNELDNYGANQYMVNFESGKKTFSFSRQYLDPKFEYSNNFSGAKNPKAMPLGEHTWSVSKLDGGIYCDAGQCRGPQINLSFKKNNWVFGFIFYEINEISNEQKFIVTTFSLDDNLYSDNSLSWNSGVHGIYNIGVHWPDGWAIKENAGKVTPSTSNDWTKGKECFGMEIRSSDGKAIINLEAKCVSVTTELISCPDDMFILEDTLLAPNTIRGRYYDKLTGSYVYSNVVKIGGYRCPSAKVLTIGTALYDRYIHFDASLKYSGDEEDKAKYLEKADDIIRALRM